MAKPIQASQVQFVTAQDTIANVAGVQRLVMRAQTNNCYVDFDQPTSTTQSYLILTANTADTTVELSGGSIQNLYVRGSGGGGTLFIIAMVN